MCHSLRQLPTNDLIRISWGWSWQNFLLWIVYINAKIFYALNWSVSNASLHISSLGNLGMLSLVWCVASKFMCTSGRYIFKSLDVDTFCLACHNNNRRTRSWDQGWNFHNMYFYFIMLTISPSITNCSAIYGKLVSIVSGAPPDFRGDAPGIRGRFCLILRFKLWKLYPKFKLCL